jgi:hypothetical protein
MKFLSFALILFSLHSVAGSMRMFGSGECSSIAPQSSSLESQKDALTKCAESRAHADLSKKCEGRGNGWLLESEIARRDFKTALLSQGRSVTVSALAAGRCEF